MGFLATIGSVSPFVGLFGTVWGIMNSFSAIAARHDTTLAVVAPGIAEALFATAMGLLAAIPAVIFYNRFVAEIGRYVNRLDAFADEFSAILSRQLDEKVALMAADIQHASSRGRGADAPPRHGGDQRHAFRRRDAGAADRLHGDGAAAHRRRAGGPAQDHARRRWARTASRCPSPCERDGTIFLQKEQVPQDALVRQAHGHRRRTATTSASSCAATTAVDYGKVMEVMGLLAAAGFTHIGLVTDVAKPKPDAH